MNNRKNIQENRILLSIGGYTGVGKSSIVKILIEKYGFVFSVSTTTRAMRAGEENGKNYHFVTRENFEEYIKNGELIEHLQFLGNYYGTHVNELKKNQNEKIVFDLDYHEKFDSMQDGLFDNMIWCLLMHSDKEVLKQRLRKRAIENSVSTGLQERLDLIDTHNYDQTKYDMVVDVTNGTPEEIADKIIIEVNKYNNFTRNNM